MSDCQRAAELEALLSRGETPPPDVLAHAEGCRTCAATLRANERLDARLEPTLAAMITEPMPPARDLLEASETSGGWSPRRVAGALVAAAAVVALIVGASVIGPMIGISGPAPGTGSPPTIGSVPDDMAGWAAEADESILDHLDRHFEPSLTLVRLERCGDVAIAFYADPRSPTGDYPLLYGVGAYREQPYGAGSGGVASSVDEPEAAYARSQIALCEIVFDTVLSREAALAAYLAQADGVRNVRVLATKLVTANVALAYIDEVRVSDGSPHQQIAVLGRNGGAWAMTGAQGGDYPVAGAAIGVTPLGVAKGMPDDRHVVVGTAGADVVAVELDFDGFAHRYPVSDGAFVIQVPASADLEIPYRLIDATGTDISSGTSRP